MTKTQAIKGARSRVSMYRMGRGWIVSRFDREMKAWREWQVDSYSHAMTGYRFDLVADAVESMTGDKEYAESSAICMGMSWETGDRWTDYLPKATGK